MKMTGCVLPKQPRLKRKTYYYYKIQSGLQVSSPLFVYKCLQSTAPYPAKSQKNKNFVSILTELM
jgi:hypothetical protein